MTFHLLYQPKVYARLASPARRISSTKVKIAKTQFAIPRGTHVSMTAMINHWDTQLFPDPDAFDPKRWLLPDGKPDYKL